jgi:hypothetical protein
VSLAARKLEISPDANESIACNPPFFYQKNQIFEMKPHVREECWVVATRILTSVLSDEGHARQVDRRLRVAVQRIKYQDSARDLEDTFKLLRSALGSWGRAGYRLDEFREQLSGPLARRGLRDIVAALSLLSPIRPLIAAIQRLSRDRMRRVPDGYALIHKPHFDTRYFSAICGRRDHLLTQVYHRGVWSELPISCDDLAVFPGLLLRERGIQATLHRVLLENSEHVPTGDYRLSNTSLLIGAK